MSLMVVVRNGVYNDGREDMLIGGGIGCKEKDRGAAHFGRSILRASPRAMKGVRVARSRHCSRSREQRERDQAFIQKRVWYERVAGIAREHFRAIA
jgi:hypothetical protein